jgi:membrane protease YdiL (CAAX protease family)
MADKARLFKIDSQPPLIQLIVSFLIVIFAGTLLFYLFVFAGSLIFGTEVEKMLIIPSSNVGIKENLIIRYVQFFQQIALFVIPSLIIIYLVRRENEAFLGMNKFPKIFSVLLVVILSLMIIPVTSYTGMLNSKMNLPDWLSGVEDWMRTKEDGASDLTGLLITSTGFASVSVNMIILAVVPAFGEELLFRGILQQLLCRIFRSGHSGIWIAAIIFSTIHFQFFGFIPRLILGLSFGYLFFWSRNLWIPVIAHFVNNAVPVILSYYVGWTELRGKAMNLNGHEMVIPFVQIIFSILIFYFFWSDYRKRLNDESGRINGRITS